MLALVLWLGSGNYGLMINGAKTRGIIIIIIMPADGQGAKLAGNLKKRGSPRVRVSISVGIHVSVSINIGVSIGIALASASGFILRPVIVKLDQNGAVPEIGVIWVRGSQRHQIGGIGQGHDICELGAAQASGLGGGHIAIDSLPSCGTFLW